MKRCCSEEQPFVEPKEVYLIPKLTKQLFWNLKTAQNQPGKNGDLAEIGLQGISHPQELPTTKKADLLKQLAGIPQHLRDEMLHQMMLERKKNIKEYVRKQQQRKG